MVEREPSRTPDFHWLAGCNEALAGGNEKNKRLTSQFIEKSPSLDLIVVFRRRCVALPQIARNSGPWA